MRRYEQHCRNEGAQAPTFCITPYCFFHAAARSAQPRRGGSICGFCRVVLYLGRSPKGERPEEIIVWSCWERAAAREGRFARAKRGTTREPSDTGKRSDDGHVRRSVAGTPHKRSKMRQRIENPSPRERWRRRAHHFQRRSTAVRPAHDDAARKRGALSEDDKGPKVI